MGEVDDPIGLPRNRHLGRLDGVGHKVLAKHVSQCFFITNPCRPSFVVVRRGKRNIIGMADEDDFDMFGDPNIEDDEDDDDRAKYTTRRSRTTLPRSGRPFKRSSHDVGHKLCNCDKKRQEN